MVAPVDNAVQRATAEHDSGDGWLIEHNTIENNGGAALMAGKGQVVRGNCLRDDGQYGINAYKRGGLADLVVAGNEITGNNTDDWETQTPAAAAIEHNLFENNDAEALFYRRATTRSSATTASPSTRPHWTATPCAAAWQSCRTWGTYPEWSPYKGTVVQQATTFDQENTWRDNTYVGPWTFTPYDRSRVLRPAEWQAAPYEQDVCSAFDLLPTTC